MRGRWKQLLAGLFAAAAISLAGGSIHPGGDVKVARAAEGLPGDGDVRMILARSCGSCHAEGVPLPWYGHLAPASWLLEHDVREARSHMNLSRWSAYSAEERETLLAAIGAVARTGAMPPRRFTLLHPNAVLNDAEKQQVYQWSKAERRKLRR